MTDTTTILTLFDPKGLADVSDLLNVASAEVLDMAVENGDIVLDGRIAQLTEDGIRAKKSQEYNCSHCQDGGGEWGPVTCGGACDWCGGCSEWISCEECGGS